MKKNINSFGLVLLVALCGFLGTASSSFATSQPVLTVSPATVRADYVGKITITITGLAAGKTVRVEKYIDLNGDHVINGNDSLQRSFTVTDGVIPAIGGQRNLAVPGDDNATSGQITVLLDFPGVNGTIEGTVGNFVFKVSDTNSTPAFTPVTQPFAVTANNTLPQGVSGKITLPNGSAAVGAFVVLMLQNGSPPAGVITDGSGNFTAYCPPGSYTVLPVLANFIADTSLGNVTVAANAGLVSAGTQAMVAPTTGLTLSGKVMDAITSAGLPAQLVQGSANNLSSITLSDANGNYSLAVTANTSWQIKAEAQGAAELGYLKNQNKIQTSVGTTSVANVNIALQQANALIYGTISNNVNQALVGVTFYADDTNGLYEANGLAIGPNGAYTLGVLGGTGYNMGPDSSTLPAGYTANGTNVNVSVGQAVPVNFALTQATAYFQGHVQDNLGNPIANENLVVQPYPIINGGSGNSIYPQTDGSGNFSVGVTAGTWNIALECVAANQNGYVNQAGPAYNFTIANNATNSSISLVFQRSTATISGTVTDNHGNPLGGVEMSANQNIDANNFYYPGCAATDSSGHYTIHVLGGSWTVFETSGSFNNANPQTVNAGSTGVNFVLTPSIQLAISPSSLGNGTQGAAYNAQLSATGGTSYTWNFDRGWLPSGLSLNPSTGQITGTPGESGSFNFKVRATDVSGATTTMIYTLTIASSGSTPAFTAPFFTNLTYASASQNGFQIVTVPGQTYAFENSTNLKTWVAVGNLTATNSPTTLPLNNRAILTNPQLFLRGRIGRLFTTSLNFNFYAMGGTLSTSGGGAFGSAPVNLNSYRALLSIAGDPNSPDASTVLLTGPAGSGLSGTAADSQNSSIGNEESEYESPAVNLSAPTLVGTWSINDGGTTNFSISVPDPQYGSRLIIPVPIATVSGGLLQSVTWTYKDAATLQTSTSVPPAYITQIQVQIDGLSNSTSTRLYNSPQLVPTTTQHTLANSITWANVQNISMAYEDTLGNSYVISFNIQVP